MAIPSWPTPTNDSGGSNDGTPADAAWVALLHTAVEGVVAGNNNPSVFADTIIDEVITARGASANLNARINAGTAGIVNPGVTASAIIDEVVAARGSQPNLDTRLEAVVTDSAVPVVATAAVIGAVSISAQVFAGVKDFNSHPRFEPGTSNGTLAPASGVLFTDIVVRTGSGTSETDATVFTLPANVLDVDGKALRIYVAGKTAAGASTRTIKLHWNGASVHTYTTIVASGGWEMEAFIVRKNAALQMVQVRSGTPVTLGLNTAVPAVILSYNLTTWDGTTPTDATLSGTVAIKTTLQDSAAGTNVTQIAFTLEVVG